MNHLSPDTFVDLLEGTVSEDAVPHLASCALCRDELASLLATWQAAVDADVPEPSPLFWDHLSARVADAVAAESQAVRRPWWRLDWSWNVAGLAAAAAAAVIVVVLVRPAGSPTPVVPTVGSATVPAASGVADLEPLAPLADDESIGFVADLAANLDWDGVAEGGLSAAGSAARAVSELDENERIELQRLLSEELGASAGTL